MVLVVILTDNPPILDPHRANAPLTHFRPMFPILYPLNTPENLWLKNCLIPVLSICHVDLV